MMAILYYTLDTILSTPHARDARHSDAAADLAPPTLLARHG